MTSLQNNGDGMTLCASAFCHLRWQTAWRFARKQEPKRAKTASVTSLVRHPVTKLREAIRTT